MGFHNFFGEKIMFEGPVADPVKIRDPGFSLDFHWIFTGGATRGVINPSCPNKHTKIVLFGRARSRDEGTEFTRCAHRPLSQTRSSLY